MPESRKIMQSTYLDFLFWNQFFYRLVTKILPASNEIQQTGHSLKPTKTECICDERDERRSKTKKMGT